MCVCVALGCPLDGARMKGSRCMGGGGGGKGRTRRGIWRFSTGLLQKCWDFEVQCKQVLGLHCINMHGWRRGGPTGNGWGGGHQRDWGGGLRNWGGGGGEHVMGDTFFMTLCYCRAAVRLQPIHIDAYDDVEQWPAIILKLSCHSHFWR